MLPKNIFFIYKIFASVEYSLFINQDSDSKNENHNTITNQENEQKTTDKVQNEVKLNIEDSEPRMVSESTPIHNIGTYTSSNPIKEQVYNDTTIKDDLKSKLIKKETFWQYFIANKGKQLIGGFVVLTLFFLLYVFTTGLSFTFLYLGLMFLATTFLCILLFYRYGWKNFPPFSYL